MTEPSDRRLIIGVVCTSMILCGILVTFLGTVFGLPEMRQRLNVDLAGQGDLFLIFYSGIFLSSFSTGQFISYWNLKVFILTSTILGAVGLIGFADTRSYSVAAVCTVLLGLSAGGIATGGNTLVSQVSGDARGPALNFIAFFLGLGTLVFPLVVATCPALSPHSLVLGAASFAALSAGGCAALRLMRSHPSKEVPVHSPGWMLSLPNVPPIAVLLFCESGNETMVAGWVSSFAETLGTSSRAATAVLATFSAGFTLGRLLAAGLLRSIAKAPLILASGIGSTVGCIILVMAHSPITMAAGAALTGLSFAPIYPTTLGIVGDCYPDIVGSLFGVLFSVGIFGGIVFPWMIGHLAARFGLRSSVFLPVVIAAVVTVLAARLLSLKPATNVVPQISRRS